MGAIGYGASISSGGAIPELQGMNFNAGDWEKIKATHCASANHQHEYVRGLLEPGSWSADFNYSSSTYTTLLAKWGLVATWTIVFIAGGSAVTVSAMLASLEVDSKADGLATIKCKF